MDILVNSSYIVATVLFVLGLKLLGHTGTARKGNLLSSLGMLVAVVVTLLAGGIVDYTWIAIGIVIGSVIGVFAARLVAMTAMPEMVALFNGFGGLASLLVGWAAVEGGLSTFVLITIYLSILIGGLTFTGSLLAYGKLSEKVTGRPVQFAGQRIVNAALLIAILVCGIMFVIEPGNPIWLYLAVGLSALLGILAVLPIGGADMPV